MRRFSVLLIAMICLSSCGTSKKARVVTKKERTSRVSTTSSNPQANAIIKTATSYKGVRYKFGGTTKKGMDCSGLVVTSFKSENIQLPRTTSELSKFGDWIDLKKVSEGDLLFFATRKNSRKVNHVGIVTKVHKDTVEFIHASTSKGVITSLLSERYWYFAFVQARRVL